MLAGELMDVAVKMLRADLVERALVRPLQYAPEALDPVDVRHPVDVLADAVIDRLVIELGHPLVGSRLVRVEGGPRLDVLADEALEGLAVRVLDHLGADLTAVAILHTDHGGLADHAAARTRQLFPLGERHVLAFAADVGLVNLGRPVELVIIITGPCLPDPVQH